MRDNLDNPGQLFQGVRATTGPDATLLEKRTGTIEIERLKAHVYDIIGALQAVHKELGPGLNEYCYQEGFAIELQQRGIPFEKEKQFHPVYKGVPMEATYRLDFLCKGDIVVECKAVSAVGDTMRAQLFNYMRLLSAPCGIIVNFHPKFAQIERYFFNPKSKEILSVDGKPIHL